MTCENVLRRYGMRDCDWARILSGCASVSFSAIVWGWCCLFGSVGLSVAKAVVWN